MNTGKKDHKQIENQNLKIEILEVNFRDIKEAEINAQKMSDSDFRRLVKNIKRDGCLTSAPLLMRQNDKNKMRCISGHHRIKAAIQAGILSSHCIVIDEVDESTRIRLQLAHNDIHGTPDEEILQILQSKLQDIDLSLVNLIDETLKKESEEITIAQPQFRYINICLLENSRESLVDLIESIADEKDVNWLIESNQYDQVTDLLTYAFLKGFKTPGQAFGKFLEIIQENKNLIKR